MEGRWDGAPWWLEADEGRNDGRVVFGNFVFVPFESWMMMLDNSDFVCLLMMRLFWNFDFCWWLIASETPLLMFLVNDECSETLIVVCFFETLSSLLNVDDDGFWNLFLKPWFVGSFVNDDCDSETFSSLFEFECWWG